MPTVTSGATEPIGKITILKRLISGVSFGGASRNDTVALTAGASIRPKERGETRHFGIELVPGISGCMASDGNGLLFPGTHGCETVPGGQGCIVPGPEEGCIVPGPEGGGGMVGELFCGVGGRPVGGLGTIVPGRGPSGVLPGSGGVPGKLLVPGRFG